MKKRNHLCIFSALITMAFNTLGHSAIYSVGLDKNLYTSDFMLGQVVVSVIFVESDGRVDPKSETWSNDRQTQVLNKIMTGLDWWTHQNPRSPLSFTYVSQTLTTGYEPITRPYYDETLWIGDVMGHLGYTGTKFSATRDYVNALRTQYNTDWGFVIYVVDSFNDPNGKFADGLFGYAYLGGPFMVMTYDNNGYGIGNMDVVAAHEMGHIFNALDEYAGASSPSDYSTGYFPTINGNHAYSSAANDPASIMRGGLRWGLDSWAKRMIGWVDDNNNNQDDILDPTPTVNLNPQTQSSAQGSHFSGHACLSVVPRQSNAQGNGMTLDYITGVQYQAPNDEWSQASASDGAFNSADEYFEFGVTNNETPSTQSQIRAQDVSLRVTTHYTQTSNAGTPTISAGGGGGSGVTSLDQAHAYPNPFKPTKNSAHTSVTFTNLTAQAKVQIFNTAGDAVYETINNSGTANLPAWNALNADGVPLASGIYPYLISDPLGHQKKGQLAIIR